MFRHSILFLIIPGLALTACAVEDNQSTQTLALSGWVDCASEGSHCSFSGTHLVRYGADTRSVLVEATNGIDCTNDAVGTDPAIGTHKTCAYDPDPASWIGCASEGGFCAFSGDHLVRYGVDGHYTYASASSGIACTNDAIGFDPAVGSFKGCAYDGGAAASTLMGVYVGNDPADLTAFDGWLGRSTDGVLGYTGAASWSDYDGSVGWAIGNWSQVDRRVLWSVPLIPNGANLHDAGLGAYNDHFRQAAEQLATFRPQEPVLYIRTGWEFNGNWFPWNAQGKGEDFKAAYRQFVATYRSVSNRFVFDWCPNVGDVGMNPEDAYPGDDVVDIIGLDFYWNTDWDPTDPEAAWASMRDRTWGLAWHQAFAAAHGKRTAYSEWGVRSNSAGPYIDHARDWFSSHSVVYQTYWNSNADFPGELSRGQYPDAASEFRGDFGH